VEKNNVQPDRPRMTI